MGEICKGSEQQPQQRLLLAAEAFPELYSRAEQESRRFLGGVALKGASEGLLQKPEQPSKDTLLEAAQLAALGDEASRSVVRTNVITDVAERMYKAAHQTRVHMTMVDGKLQQGGRSLENVNRNTLEQTVLNEEMLRRAKYELRNVMLFQELHAAGILQQFDAVVWSPSSTKMTQAQKKDYGFFLDTESCSVQRISADGDAITLESAFVAGKRTPSSERHDLAAIRTVAAERGAPLDTDDGTDMVGQVMLVPKGEMQGVEDAVRWYDDAAGGTFYGQDKPRRDYQAYAAECLERADSFGDMVDTITAQLIREAGSFKTPMDAIRRLDKLSQDHCVKHATVVDTSINVAVFGETAAAHIMDARFFYQQGDVLRAEESFTKAKDTADSSSCPLLKGSDKGKGGGGSGGEGAAGEEGSSSSTEDSSEKKKMTCPFCKSKVYDDPCAKTLSCWDCRAMVSYGSVVSKGDGGNKARRKRQDAEYDKIIMSLRVKPKAEKPVQPTGKAAQAAGAWALAA